MMKPSLSVILPCRDNPAALEIALEGIAAQATPDVEVIVVDDGSRVPLRDTVRVAGTLPVRWARLSGRGRAGARNAGAEAGSGTRLLFLDADSYPLPGLLRHHLDAAADEVLLGRRIEATWPTVDRARRGGALAETDTRPQERDIRELAGMQPELIGTGGHPTPWFCCYTHNLSLPADLFRRTGGFDSAIVAWGHEDLEFAYRLCQELGGKGFRYDRDAVTLHLPHYRDEDANWSGGLRNLEYIKHKHPVYELEMVGHEVPGALPWKVATYAGFLEQARDAGGFGLGHAEFLRRVPDLAGKRVLWLGAGLALPDDGPPRADHALPLSAANLHVLGLWLPFEDNSFDAVVSVDLWRTFGADHLSTALSTGLRVAPQVYLAASRELRINAYLPDPGHHYLRSAFGGACGRVTLAADWSRGTVTRWSR